MATTVTVRSNSRRNTKPKSRMGCMALALLILLLVLVAGYFILSFPRDVQKISYPMTYASAIRETAGAYQLDPARVAAVVFCESSFNKDAVSNVGARGLMQIMPETGEWIAQKLKDEGYTAESLFDPAVSLQYGCWYLSYLDNRFDGDLVKATAAYHSGQGNVDKWLADPGNSKDGVTLDAIPSSATDTYVKRVTQAYEQYKELYSDESNT